MHYIKLIHSQLTIIISPVLLITFGKLIIKLMSAPGVGYVSYNYQDTMFFTAMKNILSKGNVVHIQNEEEIDVMLHQHAFVIIDTLMNNVFHSNLLTQIERLKPVHVIIFSPLILNAAWESTGDLCSANYHHHRLCRTHQWQLLLCA